MATIDSLVAVSNGTSTMACGETSNYRDYVVDEVKLMWAYDDFSTEYLISCTIYQESDKHPIYSKCSCNDFYSVERFYAKGDAFHEIVMGSLDHLKSKDKKKIIKEFYSP